MANTPYIVFHILIHQIYSVCKDYLNNSQYTLDTPCSRPPFSPRLRVVPLNTGDQLVGLIGRIPARREGKAYNVKSGRRITDNGELLRNRIRYDYISIGEVSSLTITPGGSRTIGLIRLLSLSLGGERN